MKTFFSKAIVARSGVRALPGNCPHLSYKLGFAMAGIFLVCAASSLSAEIPEPPTVFYGQIVNRTSGQAYVLTNGTLTWKIVPLSGGVPFVLNGQVKPVPGGLSYRLSLRHHALAPDATVPSGTVPLTAQGAEYQHLEISVDGFPARILGDTGDPLLLAQATRAAAYRLDLEVFNPLPDSDGDGLPDWWEDRFGQDKYFAGDALLDRDGDGASNLCEFKEGTDPNVANTSPSLTTERFTALEGGIVGVRLQTVDSDSRPSDLRYTLLEGPAGGILALRNGIPGSDGELEQDRPLGVSDGFTQADVDAGRLVFRHEGAVAGLGNLRLMVADENPEHAAATGTVAIAVCRPAVSDPLKLAVWLDANRAAALGSTNWLDSSGNHFDAQPPASAPVIFEADSPGGNRSLRVDGGYWGLSVPDEAAAFPAGDRTIFAVFKADGSGRQQVFAGTRFELGVSPADDPVHPGQFRYATESAALYSPRPVQGQWLLAAVWEQNAQSHLELNGLWSAGPNAHAEAVVLGNKAAVGGKALGQFNPATLSWDLQPVELLSGQIGEVLVFRRALSAAERQRVTYHLLSKWFGSVLWDASAEARSVTIIVPTSGLRAAEYTNYMATHSRDRRNILLGGGGSDELRGGMEPDILVGGPGNDVLEGGGGPDVFVVNVGDGNDTLLDFNPAEGDTLDLSELLSGSSRNLADYVQLSAVGTNSWLRVNTSGSGSGFTNVEITLRNCVLRQADLESLWANGNLVARGIRVEGPAWINVAATRPAASEEGPTAGQFTIWRSGSAESSLTINLSVGGSAMNGADYFFIAPTATFAAGQSSLNIIVQPYADSLVEVPEVVELAVLPGNGYNVGTTSRAAVTIADLPERISVEAIEPLASRSGTPGYFLVSRGGVVERSTVVWLQLGGTAVNGVDYQSVSTVLMLNVGQASALIPIIPVSRPSANGTRLVELRIVADPNSSYLLGNSSSAHVWLVDEILTLGIWRARSFPGDTTDLLFMAGQDPDQDGFVNLVEYSLGLNPTQADGPEARALLPRARMRDGHLAVEFQKRVAARDIEYLVEVSSDLVNWQSGGSYLEEITLPEYSAQPEMICYQDRTPSTAAAHRYIRVRVRFVP